MPILRIFGCLLILLALASACREPIDQRAMSLMDEKRYQEVIDLVKPAIEEAPGDYELSTVYGAALLRNGQPSLAVWPLRRAYRDAPEGSPAGGLLVEALTMGGATREGIELANELLEADPDDLRLLRMRARGHARNLNREGALEDIERLIEASPDNVYNVETKVNLLTELDRLEEAAAAIGQLKELLEAQDLPRESMARFCGAEGEFLRKHGDHAEAEAHFTRCLEEFPGEPDVVAPALQFYDAIGEHARGVEMLAEQAASPDGKNRLRIQGLFAQVLAKDGRKEEGEAVLLEFAERFAEAPQPWLELADLYAAHDKMKEAGEALEKGIEITTGISPGDLGFVYISLSEETRFAYADIMVQVGNFDRVREILRYIDEPAHKLLIEARLKLAEGDPQGALDTYQEAFTLWSSNPGGRYLAGVAALRLGKLDVASEMFQDSMRADAKATDAGLILTRMKFLSDQPVGVMEVGGFYSRSNTADIVVPRMMLLSAAAIGASGAMEGLRGLITARGDPGHANADYASALRSTTGREAAIEYLDGIDTLDEPPFAPALAVWLGLMVSRGDGELALERVAKASKAHPESASILLIKSHALRIVASDDGGALAALDRAIELDPELASARAARGHYLETHGEIEAAVAEFDAAAELDPSEPDFAHFAALALFNAGRIPEAEVRLRAQLDRHPWHGESAARLARIVLDREDSGPFTLALARLGAEYGKASRPFALETLARVRLARDEIPEAQAALQRAIQLGNPSPGTLYLMARVLARNDRIEDAMQFLELSLETGDFAEAEAAAALRSDLLTRSLDRS